MKIDTSHKYTPPAITPRPMPAQQTASAPQDAVSLSQVASSMQSNEKPPVNSARIQEIKQAIAEGRFKINPEAIADRLIESARDLLNSSKREA